MAFLYLMIFRQIISVSLNQLVAHLYDVVDGEGGRGERIEHSRLIDGVLLKSYGCLNGEKLNVYVRKAGRALEEPCCIQVFLHLR